MKNMSISGIADTDVTIDVHSVAVNGSWPHVVHFDVSTGNSVTILLTDEALRRLTQGCLTQVEEAGLMRPVLTLFEPDPEGESAADLTVVRDEEIKS